MSRSFQITALTLLLTAPVPAFSQQAPAEAAKSPPAAGKSAPLAPPPIFTLPGIANTSITGAPTAPPPAASDTAPAVRDWRHSKAPPDLAFGAFQLGLFVTAQREAAKRLQFNPNDAAAMTLLGEIYRDGLGVKPDAAAATRWFRLAAGLGDGQAAFAVARTLLDDNAPTANKAEARRFLEQAASAGHGPALYNLGVMAIDGEIKDYKKAAELFRKAMEQGDIDGAYALSFLLREGLGVEKNPEAMLQALKFAAERRHNAAEVDYAIALFNGNGVEKDEKAAAVWFTKAAWRNSPVAQNRLARLYAAGRGVKQDDVEAMKWHIIARSNGVKDDWLEDRLPKLTKTQRALVDEAVRKFASSFN